ncbi:MAG: histidine triad nucleotide-binding protein [Clostridia bacterium]|nr:histidine triad nucleotide-binding protein [Clostridia bacterium]
MENCLFCKIIAGEIPSQKVYEDNRVYAFRDINPAAKYHVLVVPKEHIESVNDITAENADTISHIFLVIKKLAEAAGIAEHGYRVVNNCGEDGGQSVNHLHFHILGGEKLKTQL